MRNKSVRKTVSCLLALLLLLAALPIPSVRAAAGAQAEQAWNSLFDYIQTNGVSNGVVSGGVKHKTVERVIQKNKNYVAFLLSNGENYVWMTLHFEYEDPNDASHTITQTLGIQLVKGYWNEDHSSLMENGHVRFEYREVPEAGQFTGYLAIDPQTWPDPYSTKWISHSSAASEELEARKQQAYELLWDVLSLTDQVLQAGSRSVAALGFTAYTGHSVCHYWGEPERKAPNCGEQGYEKRTCYVCGKAGYSWIPATGAHIWDGGTVIREPTCAKTGLKRYTCTVCKITTRDEIIPATGVHTWDKGVVTQEPSCTETGVKHFTCKLCKTATKDETVPALGHAWKLTEVLTEAEGEAHGAAAYTCTRCGETKEGKLCAAEVFIDMPKEGNWAHDPIDWAWRNGVTGGQTYNSFGPKGKVTRAQFVTFLWALMGRPEPEGTECPFTDVKESAYYYKAVLWAAENKITGGTSAGKFSPKSNCTRGQIVTFLWSAAGKPEPEGENPFTDVPAGKYYSQAVLWAYENSITGGTSAGKFSPKADCTRAQTVTFLYKANEIPLPEDPADPTDPTDPTDPDNP